VSERSGKRVLLDLEPEQLAAELAAAGQPAYRTRQVLEWIHGQGVLDPHLMTNLPLPLRDWLGLQFEWRPLKLEAQQHSADGSIKYAWRTPGGAPVEAVLMPNFDYGTVLCVSSQSGCPLNCGFCQTGRLGLREQLSAGLILQQLCEAELLSGAEVDRVVFMGMGEPLLNLKAVRRAVATLTSDQGRGWSARRISISTVGLVKPLRELALAFPRVNLALSLHFTTAAKRRRHMPGAEPGPDCLAEALHFFRRVNGGKVSVEYALLDGLNDRDRDARRLAEFSRLRGVDVRGDLAMEAEEHPLPARQQPLPLHVNLIAYNPIAAAPQYQPSGEERVSEFARLLRDEGVPVTVRRSRGADIAAACGQLGSELAD